MVSLIKKGLSLAGVLVVVALVLNLNVGGRPSRDRALEMWNSEGVQKVYRVVRDRFLAVIRKDISVEDAFKPDLPGKKPAPAPQVQVDAKAPEKAASPPKSSGGEKVIQLEKLDEQDRKALEKILEKSSN